MPTFETKHQMTARWDMQGSSPHQPLVVDDNGNIYWALMNLNNRIEVSRISGSSGLVSTIEITPQFRQNADIHFVPNIGIDRDGFLHLMGPTHNDDIDYWVSNQPNSIGNGEQDWTPQPLTGPATYPQATSRYCRGLTLGVEERWAIQDRNPPTTTQCTYATFIYGPDGEMFLTWRHKISLGGSRRNGVRCGNMQRYDEASKLWVEMGGNTNPNYLPPDVPSGGKINTFVWEPFGAVPDGDNTGHYVNFSGFPQFDINGRLHYAYRVFLGTEGTGHGGYSAAIGYMYSDDNGVTWRLANGDLLTGNGYPVVVPTGLNEAALYPFRDGPGAAVYDFPTVCVDYSDNDNPIVFCVRRNSTVRASKWNGSAWVETNTNQAGKRTLQADDGVIYLMDSPNIRRNLTVRDGAWSATAWSSDSMPYSANAGNQMPCRRHMRRTNKILANAVPNSGGGGVTATLYEYTSDDWVAPSITPPTPPPTDDIVINWTHDGLNVDNFTIQRSINDGPFSDIAQVDAAIRTYRDADLSTAAKHDYIVRANKAGANPASSNELVVAAITTITITNPAPDGIANVNYSHDYELSDDAFGQSSFQLIASALPPGWSLSTAGNLSATQPAENDFSFDVQAVDSLGSVSQILSEQIIVAPAGADPNLQLEWGFDEGSGTSSQSTGVAPPQTCTFSGTARFSANPKLGTGSLRVDGSNNCWGEIPGNSVWDFTQNDPWTLFGWFMILSDGQQFSRILHKGENSYKAWLNSVGALTLTIGGDSREVSGVTPAQSNVWHSYAMVSDPVLSERRFYFNGLEYALINSVADNTDTELGVIRFGARSNGSNRFNGLIDATKLYDRVLTQAEITALASE